MKRSTEDAITYFFLILAGHVIAILVIVLIIVAFTGIPS